MREGRSWNLEICKIVTNIEEYAKEKVIESKIVEYAE